MSKFTQNFEVIALCLAVSIAAIIGLNLSNLLKHYSLSQQSIITQGKIISKERDKHMYLSVEYEVNNSVFITGGHAEKIGKTFDSVQLYEKVPVYYDPTNPSTSTLGDPDNYLRSSVSEFLFILFIPFMMFFGYKIKKRV